MVNSEHNNCIANSGTFSIVQPLLSLVEASPTYTYGNSIQQFSEPWEIKKI